MQDLSRLDQNFAPLAAHDGLDWYDALTLGITGAGWRDTVTPFTRLPAHAQPMVNETAWKMGLRSAGLIVRFATDANAISAKWTLLEAHAFEHMAAAGVKGLDLYRRENSRLRFVGVALPSTDGSLAQSALLYDPPANSADSQLHEYCLHLPLYSQVTQLHLGVPAGARVAPAPPLPHYAKPIVIYGTSIVHGGCASRPGMAYPNILRRILDRPVVSLGLDGSAMMYQSIAPLIAEVDASIYVIDSLPNMNTQGVSTETYPFVQKIRELRPLTPIVLVEAAPCSRHLASQPLDERNIALRTQFARLLADGVQNLHLIPHDCLVGDDYEATVDGTHPTDLGFLRIAQHFAPLLRNLG